MHGDWLAAPSSSYFISIKTTYSNSALKIWQFNVSFAEFGLEMEKLLLSKKLFYFQTSY